MANGIFGGGTGTELDPYLIEDAKDFNALYSKPSSHYRLVADIDFSVVPLVSPDTGTFEGSLDGYGFTLSNFSLIKPSVSYVGIFRAINKVTIKNINIRNVKVTGNSSAGVLIGASTSNTGGSLIENINIYDAEVEANSLCGGILGQIGNYDTNVIIKNCSFKGQLTRNNAGVANSDVGGIVGGSRGSALNPVVIEGCKVDITIISTAPRVGGLIGYSSYTNVLNSFAKTKIVQGGLTTTGLTFQGGLIGYAEYSSISSCYCNVDMNLPKGRYCGGLLGNLTVGSTIDNCYGHGTLSGEDFIGGLLASSAGAGRSIKNSYSTTKVNATGANKSALLTSMNFTGAILSDNFCDIEATSGSGGLYTTIAGTFTGGVEGKTTAQMKTPSTFSAWDTGIWRLYLNEYPKLFFEKVNKSFILLSNEYKKYDGNAWQTISATLPSVDTFKSDGMSDLSILDRIPTTISIPMDDNTASGEVLGEGKVFKERIDLKKYFEIKSIDVK